MEIRVSIIIAVLNSHEIVKRQLMHFNKMEMKLCEVIIVDDGSEPPLELCYHDNYSLNIIYTNDERPWSQPCARNRGAEIAKGEYLFMTDIDHVISQEAIWAAVAFDNDKMMFPREWAVLDIAGDIDQSLTTLVDYGMSLESYDIRGLSAGGHHNTFVMKRSIYEELGGYDENFCGKYGGDDVDFANRYGDLHRQGKVARHVGGPRIFVFPDPSRDKKKVFHDLRRRKNS